MERQCNPKPRLNHLHVGTTGSPFTKTKLQCAQQGGKLVERGGGGKTRGGCAPVMPAHSRGAVPAMLRLSGTCSMNSSRTTMWSLYPPLVVCPSTWELYVWLHGIRQASVTKQLPREDVYHRLVMRVNSFNYGSSLLLSERSNFREGA